MTVRATYGAVHSRSLVLLLAALVLLIPCALFADVRSGALLRDALIELNEQGAGLLFSSELVSADLRVSHSPKAASPLEMAREILAEHGLVLEPAPGGRWLVARAADQAAPVATGNAETDEIQPVQPVGKSIDEVLVIAGRYRMYGDDQAAEFDHDEIARLPNLADDLMRAISRLPAVTADDFSARINLRGGTREETALYLDGLKLVDPFHLKDLQGAMSIVDSNLIESVQVLPGGFTAKYGDQASGIVRVDTLPAPEKSVHSVGVSFVNAFANTRGSFNDGRGGWLVSIRRGYLDWLFQLVDTGSGEFTPRYLDFVAKVEHDIGDRHVLSGHVLAAQDDLVFFDDTEETRLDGNADTLFLWGRLRSFWTDNMSSELLLWQNKVDRKRDVGIDDPNGITAAVQDLRDLKTLGLRGDMQWRLGNGWSTNLGIEASDNRVSYDYTLTSVTNSPATPGFPPIFRRTLTTVDGGMLGFYGSVRKQFDRLAVELGYRHDTESYTGLDESVSSPRFNLRYDWSADTALLFAWGDYNQFQPAEALQVEDGLDQFGPFTSTEHRVIGIEHRFNAGLSLRADAYQKRYRRLRPRFTNLYDSYEAIPEAEPDRVRVDADSAYAEGVELTLKRRATEGLSWWASYTYSKIEDSTGGTNVPREWDQPHAVNAVVNWQGQRWNFNVATAWHTGWPRTGIELGTVNTPGGPRPGLVPGERNAERNSDYLRVDTRVSRNVSLQRGTFTYFFEIYNLFDTKNACCIDEVELLPGPTLIIDEQNWLPRMPSFGFSWTFE